MKNPGGRKPGNSIRTAAGSGSDGKFSLAAFNYQNGVSPGAPDDGSTFESVVVQNGDNYTKISKRVYGTVKYFSALAVFNQHRISEPKNMRPGMVVLVPAREVLEERYPEFFVDSQSKTPEPAGFLLLEDGTPAYRLGERETISEISERFLGRSSRWIEIYRLNQSVVKDPNKLKAGLILALPADAAEVNVVP
ncbi:MAG: LysM peptidoglycan-binding domain-containing protein [Planctomycetaceae bacterium]